MAGIYIHIPFCKKICYYCDFYFSLNFSNKRNYISALLKEIEFRHHYIDGEKVDTIYFGGGTPSVLSVNEIAEIIERLGEFFDLSNVKECTLETNPDDITVEYLKALQTTIINRLSIGIQSFDDNDLKLMNRRHSSSEAFESVRNAKDAGFNNISIDLMYGLPNSSVEKLAGNIDKALSLDIQHISAYHLTIEKTTAFSKFAKTNVISIPSEEESVDQYTLLLDKLKGNGFIHYEISNFCKPGFESIHNSSYWKQDKYIGFGSSAHSFNGFQRQWNVSNNLKYISAINAAQPFFEVEDLTEKDRFNEYVMISLRTKCGVDIDYMKLCFPIKYCTIFERKMSVFISQFLAVKIDNAYVLTEKGLFLSDKIISDLFVLD